jgi:hypothetical protein
LEVVLPSFALPSDFFDTGTFDRNIARSTFFEGGDLWVFGYGKILALHGHLPVLMKFDVTNLLVTWPLLEGSVDHFHFPGLLLPAEQLVQFFPGVVDEDLVVEGEAG